MIGQHWVATDFGGPEVFELRPFEVRDAGPGEVTIEVRAAGMNPADYKHVASGSDRSILPVAVGYEVAGVIVDRGADAELGSGGGAIGDEVLAFRIAGGYGTHVTVPASDVFAKPPSLGFPQAANLLLVGTTAAEMLDVTSVAAGDTILVHGASGAVGVSVLQQARALGAHVIGTASESRFDIVRRFGGEPVAYGAGLADRVHALGPVVAGLDTVGTTEAGDVSLELVADRDRIVTIADASRARTDGFHFIVGRLPASTRFRDAARPRIIAMAGRGELVVPIAREFPLAQAREAMELLRTQHPGGKLALIP